MVRTARTFLIIMLFLSKSFGLDIDVAPYGTVAIREGLGRIQTGSYELVITTGRPGLIQQQVLRPLLQRINDMLNTARNGQLIDMTAYFTRLRRLQAPPRRKRGLVNAVGEITKSLFGIATEKDVNAIRNTVNDLVAESNRRKKAVRDLVVCVNRTIELQQQIQEKVNVLVNHVNALQENIEELTSIYNQVGERLYRSETLLIIENILSLAEEIYNTDRVVIDNFQYKRDLAVIGHLTETLLPRDMLKDLRKRVKIDLDDAYLYANLQVRVMRFDADNLGFWVSLPILEGEPYTLWRVLSVPFPVTAGRRRLVPEVTAVGHGLETGNYIEADLCKFENPKLCSSPVEYNSFNCISSILRHEQGQIENCEVVSVNKFDINVKRVTPLSVIISTDGETVEERCPSENPRTFNLEANAYLLTVTAGCVLEGENWTFKGNTLDRYNLEIEESVQLLPESFNVSLPVELPKVNFNLSAVNELLSRGYPALPDITDLNGNIKLVTLSGSVAGYVAVLIIVLVIIVVCFRHFRERLACWAQTKFAARARTVDVKDDESEAPKDADPKEDSDGHNVKLPVFKQFCGAAAAHV